MMTSAQDLDRYQAPAECIRAARAGISEIMRLLRSPTAEDSERCTALLGDVGTHLQSAASILREHDSVRNADLRHSVVQLQREVRTLAVTLTESDRLVSGWVRRLGVKAAGYTERGASAPLILIKKVNVTG
jgi:hypothetical protein